MGYLRAVRGVVAAVALAACAAISVASVQASTLTFEDVSSRASAVIPNGYGGLYWNNLATIDPVRGGVENNGYLAGTTSGKYTAFNGFGDPASISALQPFDLIAGNFTAAWRDGLKLTITGYRNGAIAYATTLTLQSTGYLAAAFHWTGLDLVTFSSIGGINPGYGTGDGTQFVIDDLNVVPTPLPASLIFLVTGLAAMGGLGTTRARC